MIYNKKKIRIFIIILIIVIILSVSAYFFLHKKKQVEPSILTQEQKVQILDQLGKGVDTSPAGVQKQMDTLKKLNGGKTESKPLTDEQKQKILNSFNGL